LLRSESPIGRWWVRVAARARREKDASALGKGGEEDRQLAAARHNVRNARVHIIVPKGLKRTGRKE